MQTYVEPAQAEAAHAHTVVQLTPTGRTPFHFRVVGLTLKHLSIHQVQETAPRIKHAAQPPTRAFFKFLTRPGSELLMHGRPLPYGGIMRHCQGHLYYDRTCGEVHWAAMSLPVDTLAAAGIAIAGCDLSPPPAPLVVVPPAGAMQRLKDLAGAAAALAEHTPRVLEAPEVARGLEQSLIEALVGCFSRSDVHEMSWAQRCHEMIMRRFHNVLNANPNRPIYVPELCAAIRVPERTLRLCCQEHLGMGPKQFLLLRRMHQARRALCLTTPAEATITEIATRFGFWHFGRFAGTYQSIFGESPSATLKRLPA